MSFYHVRIKCIHVHFCQLVSSWTILSAMTFEHKINIQTVLERIADTQTKISKSFDHLSLCCL